MSLRKGLKNPSLENRQSSLPKIFKNVEHIPDYPCSSNKFFLFKTSIQGGSPIFYPERATIAERQGASEDENFGAKLTLSKTNSSTHLDSLIAFQINIFSNPCHVVSLVTGRIFWDHFMK